MCAERRAVAFRPGEGEDGVALVAALLAVIVLFGLSVVFVSVATFESRSTAGSRDYEVVIHVAEGAIDDLIPEVNRDASFCSARGSTGSACDEFGLTGQGYERPADMSSSEARAWIRQLGEEADETELVRLADGEGFAIRPVDPSGVQLDEIWAVGWVPDREDPQRVRALRIEFDRLRYNPDVGLLTGGDLAFGGSAEVGGSFGHIHANGDANEHSSVGAFRVAGDVTVAGTISDAICDQITFDTDTPSECRGGAARRAVPHVNARDLYDLRDQAVGTPWFDLCPGPEVRLWSSGGPCTGDLQWSGNPPSYRGWKYEGPSGTRTYGRWKGINIHEGVYYVRHGNAYLQSTSGNNPRAVTVLAEENTSDVHGANSGHIQLAGGAQITSALSGLALVADRDIKLEGGADITGLVAMQEQFEVEGGVTITGAVLIEDVKDTSGSWVERPSKLHGNLNIHYDGGLEVPLAGVIRIIGWNEL